MKHSLPALYIATLASLISFSNTTEGQTNTTTVVVPKVTIPKAPPNPYRKVSYPWKKNITATIFWVGERPTARNPTPNHASSWDTRWQVNFGGFDDPAKRSRYRPAGFIPKLNPFYVALPYNDVINYKTSKPEASRVIPWWGRRADKRPGKTSLKGRWLQIVYGRKVCYAQWEDCGPFVTDDWKYVFGNRRPKNPKNNNAGIDVSPAVRDYLGLKSGEKVHWRFIDFKDIPRGPWSLYGKNNPFRNPKMDPDFQAARDYLIYLRKKQQQSYRKNSHR